jgi:hypothetical protein
VKAVRPQASGSGVVGARRGSALAKSSSPSNSSSNMTNKAVTFKLEDTSTSSFTTPVLPRNTIAKVKIGGAKSFPGQKLFMRALGKT